MPDEAPLGVLNGRAIYDNAPTVCVLAVAGTISGESGILAVRRRNDPGAGKLGLPGGFHMRGEPWQVGAVRELTEETGFRCDPDRLDVTGLITDEFGHNLILSVCDDEALAISGAVLDGEAEEVIVLRPEHLDPSLWAFPLHLAHAHRAVTSLEHGLRPSETQILTRPSEFAAVLRDIRPGSDEHTFAP